MKSLRSFTGAIPFFMAIFLNAFVDLGHKIVIQNTIFKLYDGTEQVILTAIINAMILLPFILLISPAGFISDKFRKTHVMRIAAWVAVAVCMGITFCYYHGYFNWAFGLTFLLAAQSAIYSPAKMGYIKELFGKERLGQANGVAAALSIVAILTGIFAFSILFEAWYPKDATSAEAILRAIAPIGWILIANSLLEVAMMYLLPPQAATGVDKKFQWGKCLTGRLMFEDLSPIVRRRVIRLPVIGLSVFWGVGQVMLAAFPAFAKGDLGLTNTIHVQGILACTGIGIALGSILAGRVSKNYIELGLLPVGALGIAIGLLLLPSVETAIAAGAYFLLIGFMGGLFIVPLNALIQFNAEDKELGKTLAANNWAQNVVMLGFLCLTVAFSLWGFSSQSLLQVIAVVALLGCCYTVYQLPHSLTRFVMSIIISRQYRITVQGMKNMPAKGGVLLLGNHVSWIDWAIVQIASPRPVRFVMIRNIYERWYLKWFLDLFGCIPIESGVRSRKSLDLVAKALDNGDVVCLFPEGAISRTGHLAEFRKGYEVACEKLNSDVVILPFYLRGLWGSHLSRSSDHMKKSSPQVLRRDLVVAFGAPLAKDTKADVLKRRVLDLSISSWQEYVDGLPSIAPTWVESAKKQSGATCMVDVVSGRRISGTQALVGATAFARRIKSLSPEKNIGILMPTSAGGVLINMAGLLLGKVLVNLNYTASPQAVASAIEQAEIKTIYTSRRFLKKLSGKGIDFSAELEQVQVVYAEDLAESISTFEKIIRLVFIKLTPVFLLKRLVCKKQDASEVAAILFSSGSEGDPKGICLTHKNIIANVKQIGDVLNMESEDAIMANLPLFHALGLTVGQFMPLLEGLPMICHPDPTDTLAAAKAIATYRATIMFGTSTFFRLYARNNKINKLMLASIRVVIAGAEKLQPAVAASFKEKFNIDILEGYGATETTPVASVNLPDKLSMDDWRVQLSQKKGSVGMPLPGSSFKIVDPDTFEELPTSYSGMILIGGAQVMQGYLNDEEKTREVIREQDGVRWYVTGDKGYIDEDGFLFIIDRYSRFAKIGGEMVGLSSLENTIKQALNDDELQILAVNLPDEKKGEKIVLLSEEKIDAARLKEKLLAMGVTALSMPASFMQVEAIPKLGSGKTDFGKAKLLAASKNA